MSGGRYIRDTEDLPAAFWSGYVDAALWTSGLDKEYDRYDLNESTKNKMRQDCRRFYNQNFADIQIAELSSSQAGHDFWLTRNRHGTGFWDRYEVADFSVREALQRLTKAAHKFGEYHLEAVGNKIRGM